MQSFQGGVPEVYKEESPLAGILSTVYIVRIIATYRIAGYFQGGNISRIGLIQHF